MDPINAVGLMHRCRNIVCEPQEGGKNVNISETNTKNEIMAEYTRLREQAEKRKLSLPYTLTALNKNNTKADFLTAAKGIDKMLNEQTNSESSEPDAISGRQMTIEEETMRISNNTLGQTVAGRRPSEPVNSVRHSREDYDLSVLAPGIIEKIHSMNAVQEERKQELEDLNRIEEVLDALAHATNEKREKYIAQIGRQEKELEKNATDNETSLEKIKAESAERIEEAKARLEDEKDKIAKDTEKRNADRAEENERYEYDLRIKSKMEDDRWEDEKKQREQKLSQLEEDVTLLQEELDTREKSVNDLQSALDKLPELLEKARQEGEKERERELSEEHAHQNALAERDAEAATDILTQKIKSLQEDYDALLAEKNGIQAKLDKAYDDSNKLYLQTVQSTGGIKILGNAE